MDLRNGRREHITFALLRSMFEREEQVINSDEPLSDRTVYIALALCACAIVLYSLYFGLFSR